MVRKFLCKFIINNINNIVNNNNNNNNLTILLSHSNANPLTDRSFASVTFLVIVLPPLAGSHHADEHTLCFSLGIYI